MRQPSPRELTPDRRAGRRDRAPRPTSAREAIRANPIRFFVSTWPLRTLAYVASGTAVGVVTLVWLPLALALGLVVRAPRLLQPLVALERRRVTLLGSAPLADPHQASDRPGAVRRPLRWRDAEAATWRELAYLLLHATVLLAMNLAVMLLAAAPILILGGAVLTSGARPEASSREPGIAGPSGSGDLVVTTGVIALAGLALVVVAFVVIVYALPLAAIAHSALARALLAPGPGATVRTLTRSRARLIDAFEVERRRIERDLHDGAQQRLLELGMTLAAVRLELDDDPHPAGPLVDQAVDQATSALAELRELVRGIHPRVLTDFGLAAAVAELAARSTIPVTVEVDVPHRPAAHVESAAYFVIAEGLTNAVKHARATRVTVNAVAGDERLVVEVDDDGIGGADPRRGSGLTGLADRVDALDGTLTLSSPAGGPTTLTVELPCCD